ncbi:hypothetical protein RN001_000655 [Aquatica leii]|uniref:Uncharacterized protein n=1 Tax=Aquatica leii TaxID=1421715 RepID=A0AAN7SKQ8_9COLE|nr:hypothetical protein RN001_000655 [Aquatica leii]
MRSASFTTSGNDNTVTDHTICVCNISDTFDEAKEKLKRLINFEFTTTEDDSRNNRKSREGILPSCPTLKHSCKSTNLKIQLSQVSEAEYNELAMTVLDLQNLEITDQSVQTEEFSYIQGGERLKQLYNNTDIFYQLVCHLRRNMVNNEKDCIYKILHLCFSLDLARRCSLMGKHNNIKLDGMECYKSCSIDGLVSRCRTTT